MSKQLRRSPAQSRSSHKSVDSLAAMSWKKPQSCDSLSQLTGMLSEQKISLPDSKSSSSVSGDSKYPPSAIASLSHSPPLRLGKSVQKNALVHYSFGNSSTADAAKTDESGAATGMDASNFPGGEDHSNLKINDTSVEQSNKMVEEEDGKPIPRSISFTSPSREEKMNEILLYASSAAQIGEDALSTEDAMSISTMSPPPRLNRRTQSKDTFPSLPSPTDQGYQDISHQMCANGSVWLEECVVGAGFDYEGVDIEKLASELSPDARKRIFEPAPDAAKVTSDSDCASSKSTVALPMDEALKKILAFPSDSAPNLDGVPPISNGTGGNAFHSPNINFSLGTMITDPPSESFAGVALQENQVSEPSDTGTTASFEEHLESLRKHGNATNRSTGPSPRFSEDKDHLVDIDQDDITNEDVFCGHDSKDSTHPGNVEFRRLIRVYKPMYQGFENAHGMKTKLRNYIVDRKLFGGRSRFIVTRDDETHSLQTEYWARNKVSQALREPLKSEQKKQK